MDSNVLESEIENLTGFTLRSCEECSGEIVRARPHLDGDGRSIGCEDGHYVCRSCGLIVEQITERLPSNVNIFDKRYYANRTIFGMPFKLGTHITRAEFLGIINRGLGRKPDLPYGHLVND